MDQRSREQAALTHRKTSDGSFRVAVDSLANGEYPSVCSRAWYSIYQIVCAGAYLKLQQKPPMGRDNWNHSAVQQLLTDLLRAGHVRVEYSFLIECIPTLMEARVTADYSHNDGKFGKEDAEYAIAAAERIRQAVYEVAGW